MVTIGSLAGGVDASGGGPTFTATSSAITNALAQACPEFRGVHSRKSSACPHPRPANPQKDNSRMTRKMTTKNEQENDQKNDQKNARRNQPPKAAGNGAPLRTRTRVNRRSDQHRRPERTKGVEGPPLSPGLNSRQFLWRRASRSF